LISLKTDKCLNSASPEIYEKLFIISLFFWKTASDISEIRVLSILSVSRPLILPELLKIRPNMEPSDYASGSPDKNPSGHP
ncbi:MAG: hypothetical protein LBK52_06590, partial [Deltaproteobacteria bacterium]|nr:hypothetical protein [Deltaproteobacteria bacterium]